MSVRIPAIALLLTLLGWGIWSLERAGAVTEDPWWVLDPDAVAADYLVVTADLFRPQAELLAAAIADLHGLRVVTISLAEIRVAFPGAMADSADTASIRDALAFAYANWRSAPLFALLIGDAAEAPSQIAHDLLPTPHFFQDEYGGWCDGTYAMDAWYGDVAGGTPARREIAIGRLPVRASAEIAAYREKLETYVRVQPPHPRAGFVVGDLSLGQANENRRPAAQRLMRLIHDTGGLDTTALYSYDFSALVPPAGDYLPEEVGAGRDQIIDLIDSGLGILEFFGNTYPADAVTHTLWYDNHPLIPQFRAEMLANTEVWPFAIFSHCKVGAFDEYADLGISPAEDFVLAPDRGAIAAIGKGQMTYFEVDEPISREIYDQILSDVGGSCLGVQVSAGLERYLSAGGCARDEAVHTARMVNFIGDPALRLKLGLLPRELVGTFELRGAVPLQDRRARRAGWNSANLDPALSRTRLADDDLAPPDCGDPPPVCAAIEGVRALALRAIHSGAEQECSGAWTLFARRPYDPEPLVQLSPETADRAVLSYWVRQDSGVAGRGRVFVDLIASDGRVLSADASADVRDVRGRPYRPDCIDYAPAEWQQICVRLDAWAREGVAVDSIVVRYCEDSAPEAEICALLDNLLVGPWRSDLWGLGGELAAESEPQGEEGDNLLLNGCFRWDADGDRWPDFWTGGWTAPAEEPGGWLWVAGDPAMLLDCELAQPAALAQLLPRCQAQEGLACYLTLRGWPDEREDRVVVRLRDPDDEGAIHAEDYLTAWPDWDTQQLVLEADPSAGALLFEIEGISGSVLIDAVRLTPRYGTSAPPKIPDAAVRLDLWPRPATDRITLRWNETAGTAAPPSARLRLLAADGRCIATRELPAPRDGAWILSLAALGVPSLPAGQYLIELRAGSHVRCARLVTIR